MLVVSSALARMPVWPAGVAVFQRY